MAPTPTSFVERAERLPGALAALLGGLLYALGAAPGLTGLDAGELGAAAMELGVAHPPGFPLFCLVHKGVALLLPFGDAALKLNLASGLLGAATLGVVASLATLLGASPLAALGAALSLGVAPLFGLHAVTVEVYTGLGLLLGLALWITQKAAAAPHDGRWDLALALLLGLFWGHHAELRLFGLLLLVPLAIRLKAAPRRLLPVIAFGALGLAIVAYLPLRALAESDRDWGDPSSLSRLFDHLMGTRIRQAFADRFGRLEAATAWTFTQALVALPLAWGFAALGLFKGRTRPRVWLLVAVIAVDWLYACALNPMGVRDAQNGLPALVAVTPFVALGITALGERLRRPRVASALLAGFLVGVAALQDLSLIPWRDASLPSVLQALHDEAPPEALVLVASDSLAAGLAFTQVVEGARPDLAVIVRQHTWDASSVEPVVRRLPAALVGWSAGAELGALKRLSDGWPVRWEWAGGADAEARPAGLGPVFPLFAVGAVDDGRFEAEVQRRAPLAGESLQARRGLAQLFDDLAEHRLSTSPERAADAWLKAVTLCPEEAGLWLDLGVGLAAADQLPAAIVATERAVTLEPTLREGWINLARFALQAGEPTKALDAIDVLLSRDENDADALGLRGVVFGNAGELEAAAEDFRAALAQDPNQEEALAGMAQLKRLKRSK